MSHSTVLVIGEDPEAMLAPYDENIEVEPYRAYEKADAPADHWCFKGVVEEGKVDAGADWPAYIAAYNKRYEEEPLTYDSDRNRAYSMSTYNPQSRWDWYQLGGRWTGYFKLRAGASGEVGQSRLMAKPGWVDQARKADIDFDAMRDQAEAEAVAQHAAARSALAGLAVPARWKAVLETWPDDINYARRIYHSQPAIVALRQAEIYVDEPVDWFCLDAPDPSAAFVQRQRDRAGLPFAILTAQGWSERGRMGWFGVVIDESEGWEKTAARAISDAPDDALFSLYDVHI